MSSVYSVKGMRIVVVPSFPDQDPYHPGSLRLAMLRLTLRGRIVRIWRFVAAPNIVLGVSLLSSMSK